ncbi:MAG: Creatinine amidohydrolase, partial [uncultured Thermoleophilia bacterium]
ERTSPVPLRRPHLGGDPHGGLRRTGRAAAGRQHRAARTAPAARRRQRPRAQRVPRRRVRRADRAARDADGALRLQRTRARLPGHHPRPVRRLRVLLPRRGEERRARRLPADPDRRRPRLERAPVRVRGSPGHPRDGRPGRVDDVDRPRGRGLRAGARVARRRRGARVRARDLGLPAPRSEPGRHEQGRGPLRRGGRGAGVALPVRRPHPWLGAGQARALDEHGHPDRRLGRPDARHPGEGPHDPRGGGGEPGRLRPGVRGPRGRRARRSPGSGV